MCKLDDRRAERLRRIELRAVRLDEQRDADVRAAQLSAPAARGDCAGPPRRCRLRSCAPRASRERCRRRAACARSAMASISSVAAISRLSGMFNLARQPFDVVIGDVPAVFAQMRRDAVGAGRCRHLRRAHRIGIGAAARVAHRRHVIDVHAEAEFGHRHHVATCTRDIGRASRHDEASDEWGLRSAARQPTIEANADRRS